MYVGVAAASLGIGSFIFAIPHFATGPYQITEHVGTDLCQVWIAYTDSCCTPLLIFVHDRIYNSVADYNCLRVGRWVLDIGCMLNVPFFCSR